MHSNLIVQQHRHCARSAQRDILLGMGATTFQTLHDGTNAQDAFDLACSEDHYKSGHGGYSGTIGAKSEFVTISTQPVWEDEAYEAANTLISERDSRISDKWGPAGALAVCRLTRTQDVRVTANATTDGVWDSLVTKATKMTKGESIAKWYLTSAQRVGSGPEVRHYEVVINKAGAGEVSTKEVTLTVPGGGQGWELTEIVRGMLEGKFGGARIGHVTLIRRDPTTKVTTMRGGRRVLRYTIAETRNPHLDLGEDYPTLAAATARVKELIATAEGAVGYSVSGVVQGENGPLLSMTRAITSTKVLVKVELIKGRQAPVATDAWLFIGWASS
jgi:hypothetical protein